ncbi:WD40/YVTN/BNR-like repeat-containing protein [Thermodesulfobacteriota bacterium]
MKTFLHSKLLITLLFFLLSTSCSDPLPAPPDYNITLYAATYAKGIYETSNGGKSWYPLDLDQKDLHHYFKRIYLDPGNKDLMYVTTTGGGLYQINLLQASIEKRASLSDENINSIAFLKRSPPERKSDLILMGFSNLGILRTISDYEVWQPFNQGLSYRDVNVVFTHEDDMYAGTANDFFKYENSSQKWISISNGIKNKNIYSIGINSKEKTIYVGSGAYAGGKGRFEEIPCLYRSSDEGLTWSASDKGIPGGTLIYCIAVNEKKPERIYLGTSDGIYRSINNGDTWKKREQGLPKNFRVLDIKIAEMNDGSDVVYAAGNRGVYMTVDDEKTSWIGKSYDLPQTLITSILISPEGASRD